MIHVIYFMFLILLLRVSLIGISLLFIYDRMGVKNNWIALIPIVGFRHLFEYVDVPFSLLLLSLIPNYGLYIYNILLCFVMLRFSLKIKRGPLFSLGIMLLPDVFLLLIAINKNVVYDYVDELELLRLEILERERLEGDI